MIGVGSWFSAWASGSQELNTKYVEAKHLLDKHRWEEAVPILQAYLKEEPRSTGGVIGLATAFIYTGHRDEALKLIAGLIEQVKLAQRPALIQKLKVLSRLFLKNETFQTYQYGLNFLLDKKCKNAKEKFEKALVEEPDNVEILVRYGQSLGCEGEWAEASKTLKIAKKMNPYEPEINLWLGRSYTFQNQWKEAIEELQVAQSKMKGLELASLWLAEALSASGQHLAAIRVLDSDLKGSPLHFESLLLKSKLRLQSDRVDSSSLIILKNELVAALNKTEKYSSVTYKPESDLGLEFRRPNSEIGADIQKTLQMLQSRLHEGTKPQKSSYLIEDKMTFEG